MKRNRNRARPAPVQHESNRSFSFFTLLLFFSGAMGLLFQTIWFRQAKLLFGSSTVSSSLVLAAFMAGNSLGGLFTVLFQSKLNPPQKYLGIALALTGCSSAALVLFFPVSTDWFAPVFRNFLDYPIALNLLRFFLASIFMALPSTAMGMIFPLTVFWATKNDPLFPSSIALLFAANTFGAICGALLGEFYLFERFGLQSPAMIFACIAAFLGFYLFRNRESTPQISPMLKTTSRTFLAALMNPAVFMVFVTGTLFMALEVVWIRFIQMFIFPSSPVFAGIIVTIISGILTGSLLFRLLNRHLNLCQILPWPVFLSGIWVAAGYATFAYFLPFFVSGRIDSPIELLCSTAYVTFPAALASGFFFPLCAAIIQTTQQNSLLATGSICAANAAGSTIGPLLASLVFIPVFGMEKTLLIAASGYILSAMAAACFFCNKGIVRNALLAFFAISAMGTVALFPEDGFARYINLSLAHLRNQNSEIAGIWEGQNETLVLLRENFFGHTQSCKMISNGFSMSGTNHFSRRYMSMFACLPLALHPDPKDALLICFGVGVTANALTTWPHLQKIKIVDISPEVFSVSRKMLAPGQKSPLDDSRVETLVEDGRFFLQTTDSNYDLITAEPPPPKHDGVSSLYSREFFQLVFKRLREGGFFSIWLPVKQLTLNDTRAITKAFLEVFPEASLWTGTGPDWILLGYRPPLKKINQAQFDKLWKNSQYLNLLQDIFIESPPQMASCFLADSQTLKTFCAGAYPLTDDFPYRLSPFALPDFSSVIPHMMEPNGAQQRFSESVFIKNLLPETLREAAMNWFPFQKIHLLALSEADWNMAFDVLYNSLKITKTRVFPLYIMGVDPVLLQSLKAFPEKTLPHPLLPVYQGIEALADRDYEKACQLINFPQGQLKLATSVLARIAGFRIIALSLAGRQHEAEEFFQSLMMQSGGKIFPPRIQDFFTRILSL